MSVGVPSDSVSPDPDKGRKIPYTFPFPYSTEELHVDVYSLIIIKSLKSSGDLSLKDHYTYGVLYTQII